MEYRWSSARAHVEGKDDALVEVRPLLDRCGDWCELLATGLGDDEADLLRRHERTPKAFGVGLG